LEYLENTEVFDTNYQAMSSASMVEILSRIRREAALQSRQPMLRIPRCSGGVFRLIN
jgi:hypothetical protein